jgi:hypothetical protein
MSMCSNVLFHYNRIIVDELQNGFNSYDKKVSKLLCETY